MLIEKGLWMIVDKVWKFINTVRVGLDHRSSHAHRQTTFPDNLSYSPPVTLCHITTSDAYASEIEYASEIVTVVQIHGHTQYQDSVRFVETRSAHDQHTSFVVSTQRYTQPIYRTTAKRAMRADT
jgi:hypothetical protein